ncbi:MAG TPA: hypothetical protein DDX81_12610, partial [Desulfofustis sp.]|nr:hypothetical protein [Desulfofustis sp.]
MLGGCGGRPWGKVVDEQARETLIAEYLRYSSAVGRCKLPLGAEALIDAHSRFDQQLFAGSLEIAPPNFLRFTTYNPLGQPVIILTSRGDIFQAIDVFERRYR